MVSHMRTTVILPDELYKRVRVAAAEDGRTVTSFMEQALREALDRHLAGDTQTAYVVEPFHGDGLLPGVDLDDSSTLLDRMEPDARG
jgi:plasmid stability protein